ncbi:AbrB family transcriptional regulator [Azohydromonas sp. G-1-1-14]|uniref:AbrB family transcriptional regulator n=2 Tax=Azohydromonas caseinilytica TaxID=2728836 RepID=A0A848F3A9_9BURK|nr:AbrB family transcriptional regulator [Azohydromonas caseinilytica]NML13882.1 AbrB family transcriptional regulator [Azohydromonas caseinilytica]
MEGKAAARAAHAGAIGRGLLTLALAAAAALLCQRLRVPLAWTLGPLLATALACSAGARLGVSPLLRHAGQWVIGTALGLHFTPAVLRTLPGLAPALLAGVLWALLLGWLFSRLLGRAGGAPDHATAFFAGAIGGASEMAVLAERHGGRVDRVAAAHSLRVLIVVVALPWGLQAAGFHPLQGRAGEMLLPPHLLALLCGLTLAGALLARRLGTPNPWVLGALVVSLLLTGSGVLPEAVLPHEMTNAGQLLIGVSLGTRFTPEFLRAAPRWLGTVALGTVGMIAASLGFSWLLARAADLAPAAVLLGNSPGGMAEMCITAQVLQLGVPLVTAFHVVRYVAVLVLMGPLYRWEARRRQALQAVPLSGP